ncbi:hypothetical protein D9619_008884 [Psilocybe cf. subviscida]|uniref:Uncharacterized protein n=1 Tax=Psilocybe cf. subviscida TaxID=2480587 RepID=A0A8H5BAI2_9AGAR|nr:hypothetical protein D9619_008884 [Psilocybe cf. subviscida]
MDYNKDLPLTESDPRWISSITSLEGQMDAYRQLANTGAPQAQLDAAAERINATIHTISGRAPPSYPDTSFSSGPAMLSEPQKQFRQSPSPPHVTYQVPVPAKNPSQSTTQKSKLSKLHRPARDVFFEDGSEAPPSNESGVRKKRNPAVRVARGMLVVTVAPLAAAGMGLYVCGMALEGAAEVLKGIGSLGKLAMVSARGKDKRAA